MKRRWVKWSLLSMAVLLLLFIAFIHGILAVQAPVGAPIAVVEGWMPEDQLRIAADTVLKRGYTKVHTTGTVRPFSYFLNVNEGLDVALREPASGTLLLGAAGQPGSQLLLIGDRDTLATWTMGLGVQEFSLPLPVARRHFRLLSFNPTYPTSAAPNVFLLLFQVNRENVHLLQRETLFVRADGRFEKAWPTYAHAAAAELIAAGVPAERVQPIPTWGRPNSRSWGNASTFGAFAQAQRYNAVDLITLGVHARRSRGLFRRGCGPDIAVGAIAIDDPRCPAEGWWQQWRGWFYVLKEIAGAGEPFAVDLTR